MNILSKPLFIEKYTAQVIAFPAYYLQVQSICCWRNLDVLTLESITCIGKIFLEVIRLLLTYISCRLPFLKAVILTYLYCIVIWRKRY